MHLPPFVGQSLMCFILFAYSGYLTSHRGAFLLRPGLPWPVALSPFSATQPLGVTLGVTRGTPIILLLVNVSLVSNIYCYVKSSVKSFNIISKFLPIHLFVCLLVCDSCLQLIVRSSSFAPACHAVRALNPVYPVPR